MSEAQILDGYQSKAFAFRAGGLEPKTEEKVYFLGLFGEAGETVDLLKKVIGHGHPVDQPFKERIRKELGDLIWYISAILWFHDLPLSVLSLRVRTFDSLPDTAIDGANLAGAVIGNFKNKSSDGLGLTILESLSGLLSWAVSCGKYFGTSLEEILEANISKLKDRYGDRFSAEKSIARIEGV